MCTRGDCVRGMGQWVQFQTAWGHHRGVIEQVNQQAVLVRMPSRYAPTRPTGLISQTLPDDSDDTKLDLALAYGGYGAGAGGYPGGGRGYAGSGYGGGGWWWWWLAFAWIFALAFLW